VRGGRFVVALSLLAALTMPASAADPSMAPVSPSPQPSPALPPTGTVDWVPVDGVLGGSVPGLQVWTQTPVAWAGGLAILETATVAGAGADTAVWQQPAVWRSDYGVRWRRAVLPAGVGSDLSLVAWREGLAVIDTRQSEARWRSLVWSSADGVRWHRAGSLDLRPRGDLRGCGFRYPLVVGAGQRLIVTISCGSFGSGGDLAPDRRTVGLAARTRPDIALTAWSWTTTDGRHWSRHLVTRSLDPAGAARYLFLLSPVGDGATGVMCCYPPTLWWTPDGARWTNLGRLPDDVPYQDAVAVDAMTDGDGQPTAWLLVGQADHPVGDH